MAEVLKFMHERGSLGTMVGHVVTRAVLGAGAGTFLGLVLALIALLVYSLWGPPEFEDAYSTNILVLVGMYLLGGAAAGAVAGLLAPLRTRSGWTA